MDKGYIRHYRAARDHWLHENSHYYMAWFDIILLVNHTDKKVLIDKELIACKRGEAYYSLNTWVELLGKWWTLQKVRTFFKLLQADNMIQCSGMRKTTRLSVVNYEKYNMKQHTGNTQVTHKQHTGNTQVTSTKELLSITKELPSITKKEKRLLSIEDIDEIYSHYPRKEGKKKGFDKLAKLKEGNITKEVIIQKVKDYATSVNGTEKKHVALFSTWCNEERWQDECITESNNQEVLINDNATREMQKGDEEFWANV